MGRSLTNLFFAAWVVTVLAGGMARSGRRRHVPCASAIRGWLIVLAQFDQPPAGRLLSAYGKIPNRRTHGRPKRLSASSFCWCSTAQPGPQTSPLHRPDSRRRGRGTPPRLEVMYSCPGGTDFGAVFFPRTRSPTPSPCRGQPAIGCRATRPAFLLRLRHSLLRTCRASAGALTAAGRSSARHQAAAGRGEPPRTYQAQAPQPSTLFPRPLRLRDLHHAPSDPSTSPVGQEVETAACGAWCCAAAPAGAPCFSARPTARTG